LNITVIGTAIRAPGIPHIQLQNIKETKIITGLTANLRPWIKGVIILPSSAVSIKYENGTRITCPKC